MRPDEGQPAGADVRTNEELTAATASGLRWVALARIGTELLLIASMVVLARLIPPSAFGLFAVALIVQELAVNIPSEGVGSALVQRRHVERAHLQGALALSLVLALVLAALTLVLVVVVVRPIYGAEAARLVALTTPWFALGALAAVPMALLRRNLDFRRLSVLGFTQSTVRAVSSILFAAVFGLDATALVLGGLVGLAAMVALALAFAPVPLPRWRRDAVGDLLPYGGPAGLASVLWVGFRNGDYAIVGAQLGAAQAGFYYRGFQLAVEYQNKISVVMTQMAFPVLARTVDTEAMFVLRRRMVRLLTVVVFPVLATLVVVAPVLVPWMFGPAWQPAVVPTQILAGAGAATVVINAVGTVLMAAGRARAMLGYGVAHFAVYVTAVLIASRDGLVAVSIAAVAVHLVFLVVAYQLLLRGRADRTLRFLWQDVSAGTVGCLALVAAALPVDRALAGAGAAALPHLVLVALVAAVAYLVTLRLCFAQDFRDLMALVGRVLPLRRLRATVRRVPLLAGRSSGRKPTVRARVDES